MKSGHTPGMQLMLVEMVLSIGFFAVIAAVCVSIFSAAWKTAADGRAETGAVMAAQSAAECFKAAGGDIDKAAVYLGAKKVDMDTLTLYYNDDWEIEDDISEYRLQMSVKGEESGLILADITVMDGKSVIFSLQAASTGEVMP